MTVGTRPQKLSIFIPTEIERMHMMTVGKQGVGGSVIKVQLTRARRRWCLKRVEHRVIVPCKAEQPLSMVRG